LLDQEKLNSFNSIKKLNHEIEELYARIKSSDEAREQIEKVDLADANQHVI
jgi:predicted negative regulator of RcsB-dependent stress response